MTARKCWLLTLTNGPGSMITYDTFKSTGDQKLSSIDEFHSSCDAAIIYIYIHFTKEVTRTSITLFMEKLKTEQNIMLFDLIGYEPIYASSPGIDLSDHPGFKLLHHHYKTNNPNFKSCTDGKPGVNRGLLWQYDHLSRLKEHVGNRNKKLLSFLETMEKELSENKHKAEMADVLQQQVLELEAQLELHRETLAKYRFSYHVLKCRVEDYVDDETKNIILDVDHLGRPLL